MRRLLLSAVLFLCACPGFEDRFSGTYRQRIDPGAPPGSEPIGVEVFRFGHDIHTMVRFFEGGPDPFAKEESCFWTEPTKLDDEDHFVALLERTTTQIRIEGRFGSDDTLGARINSSRGNYPDLTLDMQSDVPDDTCRTIAPRSVRAKFSSETGNQFAPGEYEIRNPFSGYQWIAVQRIQTGSIEVWTAYTPELVAGTAANNVTADALGLSGELRITVQPPDEDYRTLSGNTRYSLAHFIVIDADPEEDSFVSWDQSSEPIIASGVRGGTRVDAPGFVMQHNMFGRALLFVEGSLDDLGGMREIIDVVEEDVDDDGVVDEVDPTQHFYVAEVFAEDETIVGLRIRPSVGTLTIPVTVTTEYLQETGFPLPRLFPVE